MAIASVMVICSELSHSQMYVIDLINVLLALGKIVHIVDQCRIGSPVSCELSGLPQNNVLSPNKDLHFHILKGSTQAELNQLIVKQKCRTVFCVCKDGANELDIQSRIPSLSIFILLLNYENIPRKTKGIIRFFDVLIGTGYHSVSKLQDLKLQKPVRMILPKLLNKQFELTSSNHAKAALGISSNRFVFFLDVNETPEIKCVDTVIQAFAQCQKMVPGFRDRAMLLINAAPTVQLVNILKLESFQPEEVSVHIQYYSNGLERNDTLLNHLIASADVVINMAGGVDFDTHMFLAQEYNKLVIFRDCVVSRKYCFHGIPIKQQQLYLDGLAQGLLHLPSVAMLKEAMQLVLDQFHKFAISESKKTQISAFRVRHNKFEGDWQTYAQT